MADTMSHHQRPQIAPLSADGLYFQIVCDPGHERTARELSELPRESRERVWADMVGTAHHRHHHYQESDPVRRPPLSNNPTAGVNISNHDYDEGMSTSPHPGISGDPVILRQQLAAFEQELQRLPTSEAFELALTTPLGTDPDFRLAFLQANYLFDIKQTAQRFIWHFDFKVALFGKSKVGQSIRLSDLSEDDLESLQCGAIQFLPQTDRGGRLVMLSRYRNFAFKSPENMLRAFWYMHMSALETPAVKRVGIVFVGYEVDDDGADSVQVDYELVRKMVRLVRTLPIRVVASHSCHSDTGMQKVADLVVHMVSSFTRLRMRMHYGSHQECRYRLLTMGIPVKYLPISMDGALHHENHWQWLQFRIHQERAQGHTLPPSTLQILRRRKMDVAATTSSSSGILQRIEDDDDDNDGNDGEDPMEM